MLRVENDLRTSENPRTKILQILGINFTQISDSGESLTDFFC